MNWLINKQMDKKIFQWTSLIGEPINLSINLQSNQLTSQTSDQYNQ